MCGDGAARFTIGTWLRLVTAGAALIGGIASGLSGQDLGTVAGTVITANDRPLASAQVRVLGSEATVLTDDAGHFRLTRLLPGAQTIEVRMLGYSRALVAVEIEPGLTRTVQVTLATQAVALKPVEITEEWAMSPGLRGFHERRERGGGQFFTREQIERMHPRLVTDILRRVPGVQIQAVSGPYETSYIIRMGRAAGGMGSRPCPVLFYVNGTAFPVKSDLAINQFVAPADIEAVEVYTGTSRLPPEFSSNMHNSRCGVVALWTRIGAAGGTSSQPPPSAPKP
jgi:hypothetical protein